MQELINKLQAEHNLTAEQSLGILNTITGFIKEKFPMVAGAIDNLFQHDAGVNTGTEDTGGSTEGPAEKGGSFLDKISDYIPGEAGEKAEQYAKDKLSGLLGDDKK